MKNERLPGGIANPLWLPEQNYRMLRRLVPDLASRQGSLIALGEGERRLRIGVLEQCSYTSIIRVAKRFAAKAGKVPELRMDVRVYHDAQVAEVVAYQDCNDLPPPYAIFGNGRYLRDEKRQVNHLLHDLLLYCLRQDLYPVELA